MGSRHSQPSSVLGIRQRGAQPVDTSLRWRFVHDVVIRRLCLVRSMIKSLTELSS